MKATATYQIRTAIHTDLPQLHQVFEASVRQTCCRHYSKQQIDAWVEKATPQRWKELFESGLHFFLAETATGAITGFTSINKEGYLHSMFVHPAYQHHGIATLLLATAESFIREYPVKSVFAEVSLTARPFFETKGFVIEKEQTVVVNHTEMTNFVMRKQLEE